MEEENLSALGRVYAPLHQLAEFYAHLQELAKGYVKDPRELEQNLRIVQGWQDEVEQLQGLF